MKLTPNQTRCLEFIRDHISQYSSPPTYEEIRKHFRYASPSGAQFLVNELKRKGYLSTDREWRSITLTESESEGTLPLLGMVAAGRPIENFESHERTQVPDFLIGRGPHFVLKVKGRSMIEEGIFDGDYIIVRKRDSAENGQLVVALVDGGATVKRFFKKRDHIELHPANPEFSVIHVNPKQEFRIEGLVTGVMRKTTE